MHRGTGPTDCPVAWHCIYLIRSHQSGPDSANVTGTENIELPDIIATDEKIQNQVEYNEDRVVAPTNFTATEIKPLVQIPLT